jgi:hypothetical protein
MQVDHQASGSHTVLRRDVPLTMSQMRSVAPSLFVPPAPAIRFDASSGATVEHLVHLQCAGFNVFEVGQSRSRDVAGRERTRHFVRLRHRSEGSTEEANEVALLGVPEHKAAYSLFAGVCRAVSQNDLVCVTPVRQVDRAPGEEGARAIVAAALQVVQDFPVVNAQKRAMKALWLYPTEQLAFASAARGLLHDAQEARPGVSELQLLRIEREEDNASDLWTTFNRVHEHLIRGGVLLRQPDGRRLRTRGVQGIEHSVKLSRALWRLAEAMCELKVG